MLKSWRSISRSYLYGGITFVLGLLLSAVLTSLLMQSNQRQIQSATQKVATDIADQVLTHFRFYQYGLRGLRGSIVTSGSSLNREFVAAYSKTRDLKQEFPGARGFGFVRRVQVGDVPNFVAQARKDGWPKFNIHFFQPHQGERFVIQYIEPILGNEVAIGLDIASETNRREAALVAMRTSLPSLTAPISLVQAGRGKQSFLMLLPIYQDGLEPATIAEREQKLVGWSFAPLLMEDVLADLQLDTQKLRLRLHDVTNGTKTIFYDSSLNAKQKPLPILYTQVKEMRTLGRDWRVELNVQPEFVRSMQLTEPYEVMLAGVVASAVLASLVTVLSINRRRGQELQAEQQRLAAIVSSSADAIIGKTCEGVVTDWNPAAERLFGYTAVEAVGHRLVDLLVPENLQAEEVSILARINRGQCVPHFQTQRRCRDGRLLDVSVTVSPILDAKGCVIGASKTVRDISSQKENEARIKELNASLESLVLERTAELSRVNVLFGNVLRAATEISIIATDTDGVITLFNHGAERLLGYQADELLGVGTPLQFHVAEEIASRATELSAEYGRPITGFEVLTHKLAQEGAETREWTYICRDGRHIPVSLVATAMRDEAERIIGYLGIAVDVSERKAAALRLAESLSTTQAILDTVVNPVFTIDSQQLLRSFNPAAERVFALSAKDVIGQSFERLFKISELYLASRLLPYLKGDAESLNEQGWEINARRSDGSTFPAQLSLGGMASHGNRLVVGVITDLSLLQAQRVEVLAARDQLQLAAEVAALGVWSWVLEDNHLQWNDRMFELYDQPLSLRESGLQFQHWYERVHPDDAKATVACLMAAVEGMGVYDPIFRVVDRHGGVIYVQAGAQIERDSQGKVIRVTGINRDITAQLELETRLRQAKEQADAASAAKSNFLANMSHEIRTPMNAVLGMLQLLGQTELNQRQQDYVAKTQGAASALLGLLNDILDYSKIEAGKLQLDPHPFELEALLRSLALVLPGNRGKEDVEVMFDIEPSLPQQLFGDSLRLLQVLINLTGNALKFTQKGLVQVQVRMVESGDEAIRLRFAITDTGIGISSEQQSRIFDGFTQAEASTARRFGGTGLGLAISQRLVRLMGGELQLQSKYGEGSCFEFELSLPVINASPLVTLPEAPIAGLRVLLVEDNALVAELLLRIIEALGWQPQYAANGLDAIAAVQAARQQGEQFELVLMDWKMPGLDGLSAARLILKDSASESPPMVIMLTAYDKEMMIAALHDEEMPFVDSLTKPVTPQQLLSSVQKALAGNVPQLALKEKLQRLLGLRLLVVEDNELNRQIACELLAQEGAQVSVAEGGLSGVEQVLSGEKEFDVVLMDVQMPDIDGLEATRRIRADQRFALLPIIAMTANASQADRQSCLAAGMNEHIGKPVNLPQLINVVLHHVGRAEEVFAPQSGDTADFVESITSIEARFGGNLRLYSAVQSGFSAEALQQMMRLRSAIDTRNTAEALQALHTLNGCAANVGARALSVRLVGLELHIKQASKPQLARILDESVLADLTVLIRESDARLQCQLAKSVGTSTAQHQAESSSLALRQCLLELLPLLDSGNLRALELVEGEIVALSDSLRQLWIQLQEQVQMLDFIAASDTAKELLEIA